jgi:spore germination protein (amino acid permease)
MPQMNKESVSASQMCILFFVFMTGSSLINVPGPLIARANNGAWLSLLLSGIAGLCVLSCLLYLYRRFPDRSFIEYSKQLVGPWLTVLLSIGFLSFLYQMQAAIVLDVSLFMISSMLRETPLYVFSFFVFLVAALTVRAGIEVMARMFSIILLVVVLFTGSVLLLAIPDYHPSFLLPIMPQGLKPVMHGAYFAYGFPYSEVMLFGMLLPFVQQSSSSKLPRMMIMTLIINIVILCVSTVCTIMMFGPLAGERAYALFALARNVEVQEIIQRIESVIGLSLIAGSFMKTTVTLYVLNMVISQLCGIRNLRLLIMPLAFIGFVSSNIIYKGQMSWGQIVAVWHPVWSVLGLTVPLLIITVIARLRPKVQ